MVIFKEIGDKGVELIVLNNLGIMFIKWEKFLEGREYFNVGFVIFREIGNYIVEIEVLNNLVKIY